VKQLGGIMKIYLSPSNQENNKGIGNYGTEEQYCNVIATKVEANLKKYGLEVYRNNPKSSLESIVSDSNSLNVNLHVAIHTNANNGNSRGCEVYCHRFGGEGEKLARKIYSNIAKLTPTADRGVREGYNFYGQGKHMYELAYTLSPACLIEIAFHDNVDDVMFLLDNQDNIANAISNGILEHVGILSNYILKSDVIKLLHELITKI
jgi:N-acetylmuramoyl-L-alanine amidase